MGPVRISVTVSGLSRLFGDDLASVLDVGRIAEATGVDQLVLADHLAIGPSTDRYPFAPRFPYGPEEPWLEPLTTLAALAAVTQRVRLGTGILIAPLRPALVVAKTAATLDVLSRGRLDLGVGAGWQPEEFTDPAVPFEDRVARLEDTVAACRVLWEGEPPVSFTSPTVSFTDVWCEPRPVQSRIPVLFGGGPTRTTARRIATGGDGWLPVGVMGDDELRRGIDLVRDAFRAVGRDPVTVQVRAGLAVIRDADGRVDMSATVARVPALADLGVTTVSVALGRFLESRHDIEPFLRALVGRVESATASA